MKTVAEIRTLIESAPARSAWRKGVKGYALELLSDMAETDCLAGNVLDLDTLRNGADSWSQYSWGGCAEIYNADIADRLCCPSELRRTRNGQRRPNSREEWLDVQARALRQAASMIIRLAK